MACGLEHQPRLRAFGEICHARAPGRTCAPGRTACAPGSFRAHRLNLGAASVCVAIYNLSRQSVATSCFMCRFSHWRVHVKFFDAIRRSEERSVCYPGRFLSDSTRCCPARPLFVASPLFSPAPVSKEHVRSGARGLMASALWRIPWLAGCRR